MKNRNILSSFGLIGILTIGGFICACSTNSDSSKIFGEPDGIFNEFIYDSEDNSSLGSGTSGLAYYIDDSNNTALVGLGAATATSICIPSKYNTTYTVIGFKDSGFANSKVTAYTYENKDNITTIGYQAFSNSDVASFVCPIGVTTIYGSAFQNCSSLVSFKFDSGTTSTTLIGDHAFAGCSALQLFSSPNTTTAWTIGASAFEADYKLASAVLLGSLSSIGQSAFEGCLEMGLIYLPSSITTVGDYAFKGCEKAIGYISGESVPTGFSSNGLWNYVDDSTNNGSTQYVSFSARTGALNYSSGFIYSQDTNDTSTSDYDIIIVSYIGTTAVSGSEGTVNLIIPPTIVDNDGTHKIIGIGASAFAYHTELGTLGFGSVDDPSYMTYIGEKAFYNCGQFTSMDFSHCPDLTTFQTKCFYCDNNDSSGTTNTYWTSFTSLTIPKSVVTIGDYSFSYMKNAETLIFEGGDDGSSKLETIGVDAFRGFGSQVHLAPNAPGWTDASYCYNHRGVIDITLGPKLKSIGNQAFYFATTLHSVTFTTGSGVSLSLGSKAFWCNYYLENLTFPASASSVSIGERCFATSGSNWATIAPHEIHSIYLPSNVTSVATSAFDNNHFRTTIYCGASTRPNNWSSTWNTCLTKYFGAKLTTDTVNPRTYGYYPVYWNVGTETGQRVLKHYSDASYGEYDFLTNTGSGNTCTLTRYYYQTYGAVGGTSPSVPATVDFSSTSYSVTALGDEAFMWSCINENSNWSSTSTTTALSSITLPDSITSIGYNCFAGTRSLTNINNGTDYTLPTGLTTIGYSAFAYTGITQALLPASLTSLTLTYSGPFNGCFSLAVIKIGGDSTTAGQVYYSYQNNIYTASGDNQYATLTDCAEGASTFGDTSSTTCTIPLGCTTLGTYCLRGQRKMAGLNIPYSVTSIPDYFIDSINDSKATDSSGSYGYNSLTSVRFYSGGSYTTCSIDSIGTNAFDGSKNLVTMELPSSLTSIGNYAFNGCTKLEYFPNDSTSSGTQGNLNLNNLSSLNSVGTYAFDGCSKISTLVTSSRINSISDYCFYNCTSLASLTLQDNITKIGERAFSYCTKLPSVTLPSSLQTLGNDAFNSDTKISSVSYSGTALSTISAGSFLGCTNLSSIDLNGYNLTSSSLTINSNAFRNCSKITSLVLPASLTFNFSDANTNGAFYGCSGLVGSTSAGSTTGLFLKMTGTEYSATTTSGSYVNLATNGWNYYKSSTPVTFAFYAETAADKVCSRISSGALYWHYVNTNVPTLW